MPSLSYKDVIKRLKKRGFIFYRQAGGSHELWKNVETNITLLISKHSGKNIPKGTLSQIAKKAGFKNITDFQNFS